MQKIAIFQLDNYLMSPFGKMFDLISEELFQRKYIVHLLITNDSGFDRIGSNAKGFYFKKNKLLPKFIPNHYSVLFKLVEYINVNKPDIIIGNGLPFASALVIAKVLSTHKPKLVFSIHSNINRDIKNKVYLYRQLIKFLAKFTLKKSDLVIANSYGSANEYYLITGINNKNIHIVYNPVISNKIKLQFIDPVDEFWFKPNRRFKTLIACGRLSEQKGFDILLRAIKIVSKQKNVRLFIIGDGLERDNLKELAFDLNIDNIVYFAGRKENPYSYMSKADGFVLSSRHEGLGNVLIEAMAAGCPVVSTDCDSGPSEILKNGLYGPLIEVDCPNLLANGIITILDSPISKYKLIQRAEFFNVQNYIDKLLLITNLNTNKWFTHAFMNGLI